MGDRLHFAAHSHHFWPDITRDAHIQCWDDAARLSDHKWEHVLGNVWQDVRARIAGHLGLPDPETLVPAPNTHELVSRLLSCLPTDRPIRILTTGSEFHSFRRQCARLAEEGLAEVTAISTDPFDSFESRFTEAASNGAPYDLVFFSQVFFDSGYAVENLEQIVSALGGTGALLVIDGYHGYLARHTGLRAIAGKAFYLAGGYKYAMAGEGACFMHCPPGIAPRPRNTGWYASFGSLAEEQKSVAYGPGGVRFMGSTFDASGLYRMQASLVWLKERGINAGTVHDHARALQDRFLENLDRSAAGPLSRRSLLLDPGLTPAGNFLTFETPDAAGLFDLLRQNGIDVDYRGTRLRIGFGLYHCQDDVDALAGRLARIEV